MRSRPLFCAFPKGTPPPFLGSDPKKDQMRSLEQLPTGHLDAKQRCSSGACVRSTNANVFTSHCHSRTMHGENIHLGLIKMIGPPMTMGNFSHVVDISYYSCVFSNQWSCYVQDLLINPHLGLSKATKRNAHFLWYCTQSCPPPDPPLRKDAMVRSIQVLSTRRPNKTQPSVSLPSARHAEEA